MILGRIVILALGLAGGLALAGYASTRSETVQDATRKAVKAGTKAKDWTTTKLATAKEEMGAMVQTAKDEIAAEKSS